jgi:Fe-S-cluster containining protein
VPNPSDFFQCQMCGECCKGYGGTFVDDDDTVAISEYLGITASTFLEEYCQRSGKGWVIKMGDSGYCVFWDKACTIHQVKPRMCRLWPFIEGVSRDPANWAAMHSMCPGIRIDVEYGSLLACVRQVLAADKNTRMKGNKS